MSSNQGIDSLQLLKEIQELKMQLNKTKEESETKIAKLKNDFENTLTIEKNATMTLLNSLQSAVNSLTTRVNTPVNLYQNCIQETRSCTDQSGVAHWDHCVTSSLPVNKSVNCYLVINALTSITYTYRDTTH